MNRSPRPARPLRRLATVLTTAALAVVTPTPAHAATVLHGTFAVQAGSCASGVTGSYFRMILHSGTADGPFLNNSSSACSTKSYTLLEPGKDGGLLTDTYQAQPSPPFDSNGNGRADRITAPTNFYGVDFAAATNPVDPQTGKKVPAPVVSVQGRTLTADLRGFAVAWNNQQFNQGAPKPDGSLPGNTRRATGTLDPRTGAFTLQWTSQIQGGPFDGFTGLWHLTGHFTPAAHPSTTATAAGHPTTGATTQASAVAPSPGAVVGTPAAVTSATAAPSGTPTATASADTAATSQPDAASPTPEGTGAAALVARHGTGSARWPWVLVAVVLATSTGGLVLRLRTRR